MAIVNKIQIEKSHSKISSVQDLADNFVKRVEAETSGFKRVLLVFDRYNFPMSLKSLTREQRTEGQQVHFKLTTKVSPDWICAVTSRFTKLFYCEGANIAHIQSRVTLTPKLVKSKQRCSCHTPRLRSRSPRFSLKQLKLDLRHQPAPVTPLSMEKRFFKHGYCRRSL